ncbi:hypothetical protein HDV00_008961 [Rhizophlyctis rosea]|nr:hypothetical protein HDV00_008961 [Rhizophlyctis rosea]
MMDPDTIHNLVHLSSPTLPNIASVLVDRRLNGYPYTKAGDRQLLVVGSDTDLPDIRPTDGAIYADDADEAILQPHILGLATSCYRHMLLDERDQSILLYGTESSSRNRTRTALLRQIASLSAKTLDEKKIVRGILAADRIFEAFCHAWTPTHPSTSFVARHTELQFMGGRLCGAGSLALLLDPTRVLDPNTETFHIFHWLLAAKDDPSLSTCSITQPTEYATLRTSTLVRSPPEDKSRFHDLRAAFQHLRIGARIQKEIFQVLSAILHLGNITFERDDYQPDEPCVITNADTLYIAADLLGISPQRLADALVCTVQTVDGTPVTIYNTVEAAEKQRAALASGLYVLLLDWLIRKINACLYNDSFPDSILCIRIHDTPGFFKDRQGRGRGRFLHQFMSNIVGDQAIRFCQGALDQAYFTYANEGVLLFALEKELCEQGAVWEVFERVLEGIESADGDPGGDVRSVSGDVDPRVATFSENGKVLRFRHFVGGEAEYSMDALIEGDGEALDGGVWDILSGRGDPQQAPVKGMVRSCFANIGGPATKSPAAQLKLFLQVIRTSLAETDQWFITCLSTGANVSTAPRALKAILSNELTMYHIPENVMQMASGSYVVSYEYADFWEQFRTLDKENDDGYGEAMHFCEEVMRSFGFKEEDFALGLTSVFLSEHAWTTLHRALAKSLGTNTHLDFLTFTDLLDTGSLTTDPSTDDDLLHPPKNPTQPDLEDVPPPPPKTCSRKTWLCIMWSLTWWIPSFCLGCNRKLKRRDAQIAWREKVTLCLISFLACSVLVFFLFGLPRIICPVQNVFSPDEIRVKRSWDDPWVYAYGKALSIKSLAGSHQGMGRDLTPVFGKEVSNMFYPVDNYGTYCPGLPNPPPGWDNIAKRPLDITLAHRAKGVDYFSSLRRAAKRDIALMPDYISSAMSNSNRTLIILFNRVYDVTTYIRNPFFNMPQFDRMAANSAGRDITANFVSNVGPDDRKMLLQCINALFYIGVVDERLSTPCLFSTYSLLISSIIIVAIIAVKFFVAVRFTPKRDIPPLSPFVICQIPCYTEGTDSLSKSLKSLARTDYDPARMLLWVVCDGMVVGSGNKRPTPSLVLEVLGVDTRTRVEPIIFQSLGDGDMQLNRAKVYSGLYTIPERENKDGTACTTTRSVPFIVVVKCGKESEVSRPGNRGKRDSQLILMRFLSRVMSKAAMNPLELELYRHMVEVIGVPPSMYELLMMIDADTEVRPESLPIMVHEMERKSQILGLCGETLVGNKHQNWVTKMQVYEYFLSHHLTKAFESSFGSVTCLPGCFSIYRLRTKDGKPLLIDHNVCEDFSENEINTLHMKNLYKLGEDRYLTTIILKRFPHMKTTCVCDAKCETIVPDKWQVLLSQRRRWVNSTVHNLFELLFVRGLCGFLCCSMRFIVLIDLIATLIQPLSIAYMAYLIYSIVTAADGLPYISLGILAAMYGVQLFIFVLKREWMQIIWMIIYIFAQFIFTALIPIYAFWHFDDFSWGNTRVVRGGGGVVERVGDGGAEGGKFDESCIPLETWEEYQAARSRVSVVHAGKYYRKDRRESVLTNSSFPAMSTSTYRSSTPLRAASPLSERPSTPSDHGSPRRLSSFPLPHPLERMSSSLTLTNSVHSGSYQRPRRISTAPSSHFSDSELSSPSDIEDQILPSDLTLKEAIQDILSKVDHDSTTKRDVRQKLEGMFQCNLSAKKQFIGKCIEEELGLRQVDGPVASSAGSA